MIRTHSGIGVAFEGLLAAHRIEASNGRSDESKDGQTATHTNAPTSQSRPQVPLWIADRYGLDCCSSSHSLGRSVGRPFVEGPWISL